MDTSRALRRARRFPVNSVCVAVVLACQAALLQAAPPSPDLRVELDCKIVSAVARFGYRPWVVEVRKPNGDPLFQALKGTGDTVRVRDLKPGIYQLCIAGVNGERCESVDLNLPADKKFFRFKRRLATPDTTTDNLAARGVTVAELSIPKEARAEMAQSEEAELSGNKEDAFHHLERVLALDPDYPDALNNMGVHYYRLRDYDKSIEYLRKATQINPSSFVAWANLGSSVLASGNFKEALKVNRRALDLKPTDARANMQLGLNFYYVRDYSDAKEYLKKAIKLDPASASSPQLFLAEIAILEQNRGEATLYLRDFLKLHPNSTVAAKLRDVLAEVEADHFVSVPSIDLNLGP